MKAKRLLFTQKQSEKYDARQCISKYNAFYAAKICKLDGMPCPSERNAAAKVRRRVSGEKKS